MNPPKNRAARPRLETLESRYTPAVTGALNGSTLAVALTAAGDQGAVRVSGTDVQVIDLASNLPVFTTPVSGVTALSGTGNGLASTVLSLEGTLTLSGGVTVKDVTTVRQVGSYDVTAGGYLHGYSVTAGGAISGGGTVSGRSVTLEAGTGIGTATAPFLTAASQLNARAQGDAYLANTGDVTLGLGAKNAILSVTGAVSGTVVAQSLGVLYADALRLGAPTQLGVLAAKIGQGGVSIENLWSNLTIGTVGPLNGIVAAGGDIQITNLPVLTSITLRVDQIIQTGAGNITLKAPTQYYQTDLPSLRNFPFLIETGDLTVGAGATVRSLHGSVSLFAQNQLTLLAGSAAVAIGGSLTLGSGDLILPATDRSTPFTLAGSVALNGYVGSDQGIRATVGTGSISLSPAPGSGGAFTVSGAGNIDVTANPGTSFVVSGGGTATLTIHLDNGVTPTPSATLTPTGYAGGMTFANYLPVRFSGIKALLPQANVSVTDSYHTPFAPAGGKVLYNIVVTNNGLSTANGACVLDHCYGLADVTYTSVAYSGATGNTASGTGYLLDYLNLPPGAWVSYDVSGTVMPTGGTSLTNEVIVRPPDSVFDFNTADKTIQTTISLCPMAAAFPGQGVWGNFDGTWRQLTAANASLVAADAGGDVVAEIPGQGVWLYTPWLTYPGYGAVVWTQITANNATGLAIGYSAGINFRPGPPSYRVISVVAAFPGGGLWECRLNDFQGPLWRQLTANDAATAEAVDGNGYVVATFKGQGTWFYNFSSWQQLTGADATSLAIGSAPDIPSGTYVMPDVIAAAFAGYGVWRVNVDVFGHLGGWAQLTASEASAVDVNVNGDVVAAFPGWGVWSYTDSSAALAAGWAAGWNHLTWADAALVGIDACGNAYGQFPGWGVWYDQVGRWRFLTPGESPSLGVFG